MSPNSSATHSPDTATQLQRSLQQPTKLLFGALAEFANAGELLQAVYAVRHAGYTKIDTHTPFPIHGMDQAMGLRPSKLPWLVLLGALAGTTAAVAMQYWMNAWNYPVRIGGKPFAWFEAYVPVGFELTVLFGAITTVLGMFFFNRLPRPSHPLFQHPRFARATDDGFLLSVEASDAHWDERDVLRVLREAGAKEASLVYDEEGVPQ